MYNLLLVEIYCPRCGATAEMEVEFKFGLMANMDTYHLGDTIEWGRRGLRFPKQRPPQGDFDGTGYVECPRCHLDFWTRIIVKDDVLVAVQVDPATPGYKY